MTSLQLFVDNLEVSVLTGIYSEETHLPQPLRITVRVDLESDTHFNPDTPLENSMNYMAIKNAITDLPEGLHFTLIEGLADYIADKLFAQDSRVQTVAVRIIKLALSENGEDIGIYRLRERT